MADHPIECVHHYDTRHLRTYNDYMELFGNNEWIAKILRIMESWTNTQKASWHKEQADARERATASGRKAPKLPPEPEYWITMSYRQFRDDMYGAVSEDTIKKYLAELEKDGYLERRVHPQFPYGPPQYRLNTTDLQKKLYEQWQRKTHTPGDELPGGGEISGGGGKTPPGGALPGGKSHTPPGEKSYRGEGNIVPRGGQNTPPNKNLDKNRSQNPDTNQGEESHDEHERDTGEQSSLPSSTENDSLDISDQPTERLQVVLPVITLPAKPASERTQEAPPSPALLARARAILALLCALFGHAIVETDKVLKSALALAKAGAVDEDIRLVFEDVRSDPDDFDRRRLTVIVFADIFNGRLWNIKQRELVGAAAGSRSADPRASPPDMLPARAQEGDARRAPDGALWVYWNDQWMSEAEADERGYNGGFGIYK